MHLADAFIRSDLQRRITNQVTWRNSWKETSSWETSAEGDRRGSEVEEDRRCTLKSWVLESFLKIRRNDPRKYSGLPCAGWCWNSQTTFAWLEERSRGNISLYQSTSVGRSRPIKYFVGQRTHDWSYPACHFYFLSSTHFKQNLQIHFDFWFSKNLHIYVCIYTTASPLQTV